MILRITGPERVVEIAERGEYHITRGSKVIMLCGNDSSPQILAVGHTSISRDHLIITVDDTVTLTDKDSKFGSFIDDERFEKIILKEGKYALRLGRVNFQLYYER